MSRASPALTRPPWATPQSLAEAVGQELPPTAWRPVTRAAIREFAALTGDDQPIHGAGTPADAEIVAQGALLVGLAAGMLQGLYALPWAERMLQAGYEGLRLRSPVAAGERIRLCGHPRRFRPLGRGRHWLETEACLERERDGRPVLTGRFLSLIVAEGSHER